MRDDAFERDLVAILPYMHAVARRLRPGADADDLVQDTMVRALTHRASFDPATGEVGLRRWLCVIMRNEHMTRFRKEWRREELSQFAQDSLPASGDQHVRLVLSDTLCEIQQLPEQFRGPLHGMMVGNSLEEIAAAEDCPVGTVKSRVSRGRKALRELEGAA